MYVLVPVSVSLSVSVCLSASTKAANMFAWYFQKHSFMENMNTNRKVGAKKKFTFTVPYNGTVKTIVRCVQRNGNRTLIERSKNGVS